ncbi:hypothetical protein PBI_SCTP2_245 [Salicola phage SCTP-2]|nr:hypothetical protein PBI_SCTP2_245 [Salicola phage SCTP-2]
MSFYLIKDCDNSQFIVESSNSDENQFTVKAKDITSLKELNDTITNSEFHNSDFYRATIISEFDIERQNKSYEIDVYNVNIIGYQVVSNGIIRHSNLSSDEAISAVAFYAQ